MKTASPIARLTWAGIVGGAVLGFAGYWFWQPGVAMPQMVTYQMANGREIFVQSQEVTIKDWNACHAAGACALVLRAPVGRPEGDFPATGLSWVDTAEYIGWINEMTGKQFRLPSDTEWREMAAPVMPASPDPIFTDPNLTWASAYLTQAEGSRRLEGSGSYSVTAEGIGDLDGNVWEWTQTCYAGAGAALSPESCPAFYVMGEHEAVMSFLIRDPARGGCAMGLPPAHLGMRLVLDADRVSGAIAPAPRSRLF